MSKTSSKQRYIQFMDWLPTFSGKRSISTNKKESRIDYYIKKNAR